MYRKLLLILTLLVICCCKPEEGNKTLKLATSPDYPPFEYKKNGRIVGFDVELSEMICRRLGYNLEIVELEFNSLIAALQGGKVDFIASGMTITPERLKNIDFSDTYFRPSLVVIGKEGTDLSDLSHKKIGAQLGSIMHNYANVLKDQLEQVDLALLANNLQLVQELKLERIDALLLEEAQVQGFLKANPGLKYLKLQQYSDGYAFAFTKNSKLKAQFDDVLKKLVLEGKIEKLFNKYLWDEEAFKKNSLGRSLNYIPAGIFVTLKYAIISVFFGLLIGSCVSLAGISDHKSLKVFAILYLSIFRGTPLLVQLFFIYFALPMLFDIDISAFAAGIIAFSLNSGAYVSEIIRAGIESVDKGQFEAAKSLGLSYSSKMRYIILPQAIRNILPSLVNEAINMVKESSIISVIGEADIMRRANVVASEQFSYAEPLIVAAICYYLLVGLLSFLAKFLERKMKR